jgi:hypothetical protein
MIIGHGSVPFVVVIGAKHPYLNTGQTLTANTSENVKLFVLWPTAVCHFRDFDCV